MTKRRDTNRVVRGGSWSNGAVNCRAALRDDNGPGTTYARLGFRCATRGAESMFRVRRGGWLGVADRNLSGTNARLYNLGFRCVRRRE
jgi:formylglycine-generating enzyme required for sulfatase activity